MHQDESPDQKAIRLLHRQLGELQTIRAMNYKDPKFKAWRDTTMGLLERFLGKESHHTTRFHDTRFFSMITVGYGGVTPPPGYLAPEDILAFREGCATADENLRAAIRELEDFGVHIEESKPAPRRGRGDSGGVHFNAPVNVHNFAVATDSAILRISQLGDKIGTDLKEISDLLQQSQDLSPNQVRQGVANVEALAVEVEKPEPKRSWKVVLECGQRVLEVIGKAVDLGAKFAPYTPAVIDLMDKAKQALGMG